MNPAVFLQSPFPNNQKETIPSPVQLNARGRRLVFPYSFTKFQKQSQYTIFKLNQAFLSQLQSEFYECQQRLDSFDVLLAKVFQSTCCLNSIPKPYPIDIVRKDASWNTIDWCKLVRAFSRTNVIENGIEKMLGEEKGEKAITWLKSIFCNHDYPLNASHRIAIKSQTFNVLCTQSILAQNVLISQHPVEFKQPVSDFFCFYTKKSLDNALSNHPQIKEELAVSFLVREKISIPQHPKFKQVL